MTKLMGRCSRSAGGRIAAAAAWLSLGCGGPTTPALPEPASLTVTPSSVEIDDGASAQLVLTMTDRTGQGISGLPSGTAVVWSAVDAAIATVDRAGRVTARHPGATQVTASYGALTSGPVGVTVRPRAAALRVAEGDGQTGAPGTALAQQVVVRAVDRHGVGVANVQVRFAATAGLGTAQPQLAATDASGAARSTWTLGPTTGQQVLQAIPVGLEASPVSFTATAQPPTGSIRVTVQTAGNPQSNGYTVWLNGGHSQPIAANGTVTFAAVPAGIQGVQLAGWSRDCSLPDGPFRSTSVSAGQTAQVSFGVNCGPQLEGTWRYSATVSAIGITCTITGVVLTLSHSGSTLGGRTDGGVLNCGAYGAADLSGYPVTEGRVVRTDSVYFDMGEAWRNAGRAPGSSRIEGRAAVRIGISGDVYVFAGPFIADRTGGATAAAVAASTPAGLVTGVAAPSVTSAGPVLIHLRQETPR